MNEHPEKSYVYITPLLNEVDRIKECTNINFHEPEFRGKRKIDDFNTLLCDGENIVATHSTFANATPETLTCLQQGDYTLFLDEVISIILPFNDIASNTVKPGDIRLLIEQGFISVDEYGQVAWVGPSYSRDGYVYEEIEQMAKGGNLLFVDNTLLFWEFPIEIFKAFREVYILTYMFQGSQLSSYLEYYDIDYQKMNVRHDGGEYRIVPYQKDDADIALYKTLIEFYRDDKANDYKYSNLSSTWYKKNVKSKTSPEAKRLNANLNNFFRNKHHAQANRIMWTCPKEQKKSLKGKGWTRIRRLTAEENKLSQREKEKLERQLSCFVPCNSRATNDFRGRDVLAYCCNLYVNPYIPKFFAKRGIIFDNDAFALGNLIQWVWRSAIRDGKPIKLYLPSLRMRGLFGDWLCPESGHVADAA